MNKDLTPSLPPIDAAAGDILQKIKYPCGCEAVGKAPMPLDCPTHTPQLAAPKEVLISVILDESGSMQSCKAKTIEGYNEYLNGLRSDGVPYLVTLTKFDSHAGDPTCRIQYQNEPIATAKGLADDTYNPRGGTPLYDAIGGTIKALDAEVAGRAVLVIILTDGEENQSKEFTADQIKALIKEREAKGWTFVYLGANQDAWAEGQKFGMQAGNVKSYATQNMHAVMANVARSSQLYARMAYSPSGAAASSSDFFRGTSDVNKHPGAQQLGSLGGRTGSAAMTPEERKKRARQAANARWKPQTR